MSLEHPGFGVKMVPCHAGNQTATSNGKSIDTLGFDAVGGIYQFGTTTTGTSGTVTISLQDSADDSSFTAISGATTAALVPDTGGMDAKRYAILLKPNSYRRYVRMTVTIGGTVATGATGPLNNAGCVYAGAAHLNVKAADFNAMIGPV